MKNFFIVVGLPRSGTTAIRTALAQHSNISCLYEAFNEGLCNGGNPWSLRDISDILDRVEAQKSKVVGLHHNYDLPRLKYRRLVWSELQERATHTVLIRRPNKLDQFLSAYFAGNFNHWHNWVDGSFNKNKEELPKSVRIPLGSFKKYLKKSKNMESKMLKEIEGFKSSAVMNYDDFLSRPGVELRRLQEYLDVPFERITPQTKKFARSTEITNLDELKSFYNEFNKKSA